LANWIFAGVIVIDVKSAGETNKLLVILALPIEAFIVAFPSDIARIVPLVSKRLLIEAMRESSISSPLLSIEKVTCEVISLTLPSVKYPPICIFLRSSFCLCYFRT